MKYEEIEKAIDEARRFIVRAEAAGAALLGNKFGSQVQTAACRRASMDLTRALAEMRRRG